ncbi:MAG: DoxX family protein [Nocardioides sp.]|jgi:hypothetical protein
MNDHLGLLVSALVLAAGFVALGSAKVVAHPSMVRRAHHVGLGAGSYRAIGSLELAGAAGVLAGLAWRPLGIAAALGLVALMLGAVIAHLRARAAIVELAPALLFGAVAVGYLVASGVRP